MTSVHKNMTTPKRRPARKVEALIEEVLGAITHGGGTVSKKESWGSRSLVYRIKKNHKAHYVLLNLDSSSATAEEIDRQMGLNEDGHRQSRAEKRTAVDPEAFKPDARARALLRGIEIAEADLAAAGGAYDLGQVQKLMHGVSRQRIERRVQDGTLLAVPGPSNRRRYPTIQFNPDGNVVDGLKAVKEALDFSSPWAMLSFLINPDDLLNNERPIDVLRQGNIDRVLESARRVGVQGA